MKDLFNYDDKPKPPRKKIFYADLHIHQKINYRANLGNAFYGMPYLNHYYYFGKELLQPVLGHLTKKYFAEYYLNAGGHNRIDNWKQSQNQNLFT